MWVLKLAVFDYLCIKKKKKKTDIRKYSVIFDNKHFSEIDSVEKYTATMILAGLLLLVQKYLVAVQAI